MEEKIECQENRKKTMSSKKKKSIFVAILTTLGGITATILKNRR